MWRICRSRRPRRRPRRRRSRPRCRRLTRRRPRLRTRPAFRAGASCLARRASVLRRRRTRRWRRTPSPPPSPSLLRAWSRSFARWQWHACGQEWATKATGPPRLLGHQGYWATKATGPPRLLGHQGCACPGMVGRAGPPGAVRAEVEACGRLSPPANVVMRALCAVTGHFHVRHGL
jgi:hypothetical protein